MARERAISLLGCGIDLVLVWLPARELLLVPFRKRKHYLFIAIYIAKHLLYITGDLFFSAVRGQQA